ncbi:dihydrofolate reductase family protein [Anaerorhabdus furcosa]|uniref:Dihydrofolate reductase n=1 Tax=Anaerorhabdus furcosa TaxID=118967 RepID=A0A1T4PD75_9FIRM|nr:dihydrofolate reductase family protein [Anaerorhabdus furcosa]SJZ89462.1 Dihydrofolate reductase [Anaerorhabdus furcosa]
MRKVILFIATSLDGYIADEKGSVDWLIQQDPEIEENTQYLNFINDIDTIIMGYTTYHQVVTELSPQNWLYEKMMTYVYTHKKLKSKYNIQFTNQDLKELITDLKNKEGKDIWVCGGANLINQLIELNLIDQYYITMIPILLGKGIRLFDKQDNQTKLELMKTEIFHGMVDLVYRRIQ